jgi:hypothetical protein
MHTDNVGSTSADVESWTLVDYLEEGGFPALLWDTLKYFGCTTYPEYSTREVMTTGQLLRCEVKVKISVCPTNPTWDEGECTAHGRNLSDTVQKAALEALTTFSGEHPAEIANSATKVIPIPERHVTPVVNEKLSSQPKTTSNIVLTLSPQSAFRKPCTTSTNEWWEKAYSMDTKSIDTKLRKWSVQLKH